MTTTMTVMYNERRHFPWINSNDEYYNRQVGFFLTQCIYLRQAKRVWKLKAKLSAMRVAVNVMQTASSMYQCVLWMLWNLTRNDCTGTTRQWVGDIGRVNARESDTEWEIRSIPVCQVSRTSDKMIVQQLDDILSYYVG